MRAIAQEIQGIIALHLPKDITDEEIDDLIRQVMPKVIKSEQGCVCAIYGYDFDERELYEIPEVKAMCVRLVCRGFISMMHISTLMDKEEKPHIKDLFGAMEIWAIATGCLGPNGDFFLSIEDSKLFLDDLGKANRVANDLLFPKTKDGMHRTNIKDV